MYGYNAVLGFPMVPTHLLAGDTCKFEFSDSRYPSSEWTLTFILNTASQLAITGVAQADDSFMVTLSAAQTATLTSGLAIYALRVSKDGETYTVDAGHIDVKPNPLYAVGSIIVAQRMIELIETALVGQLSDGEAIEAMSIAGRSLTNISRTELLKERSYWLQELQSLKNAKNGASGIRSIRLSVGNL